MGCKVAGWPRDISGLAGPSVADACRPGRGRRWRWQDPGCHDRDTQTELWRLTLHLTLLPRAKLWYCPERLRERKKQQQKNSKYMTCINKNVNSCTWLTCTANHWITRGLTRCFQWYRHGCIHVFFNRREGTVHLRPCLERMGTKKQLNCACSRFALLSEHQLTMWVPRWENYTDTHRKYF